MSSLWALHVVVLFYAVENWRGARRYSGVKLQLEQHGANLDWKSFAPAAIPDEQNAAMHPLLRPLCQYEQTFTPHPKWGKVPAIRWLDSNGLLRVEAVRLPYGWYEKRKYFEVEPNDLNPRIDLARWQTCFRHDTNFSSPAQPGAPAQDVLLALARFQPELRELREALSRPRCRFALHYDERPNDMRLRHLACLRNLARMLKLRAAAQLAVGDVENALGDTQDIFRLADVPKEEPVMTSFLLRATILRIGCAAISEGLARQAWSESQLVRLQALLAKQDMLTGLELAMKGETASELQNLDTIPADGGYVGFQQFESLRWVPRGWFEQNKATIADHVYQRFMPAFDSSTRRIFPAAVDSGEAALSSMRPTPYSVVAILNLRCTDRAIRGAAYTQTVNDQALLACALERHRLATGCFPEMLAALSPDYLSAVPHDVVTGGPLCYRLSPDGGFRLWSAGWNERDEGGLVKRTTRGGISIVEGDWVWERTVPN